MATEMTNPTIKGFKIASVTNESISFTTNSIDKNKEGNRLMAHIEQLYKTKDKVLLFQNHTSTYVKLNIHALMSVLIVNHFTEHVSISGYSSKGQNPFMTITLRLKGDRKGETSMLSIPEFALGHFRLGSTFIIKEADWDLYKQDIVENLIQGRKNDEEYDDKEGDVDCKGF